MSGLRWRTLVTERDSRYWVRGTELATAIVPDTRHRFQLCEHRTVLRHGEHAEYDREYLVRDAHGVTDAQIRDRVRPPVVARYPSEAAALEWCRAAL